MSNTRRLKQVGILIRETLAELMLTEVSDPMLSNLVITDVVMTADLKQASVYYTHGITTEEVVNTAQTSKMMERAFERAMPFLRRKVGQVLKLRSVPELHFRLDTHGEELHRVLGLLDTVKPGLFPQIDENGAAR